MAECYGPVSANVSEARPTDEQPGQSGEQNAATKLGSEAVKSIGAGSVWPTRRCHQPGPCGESHWIEAEADEPGEDHLRPERRAAEDLLAGVVPALEQPVGDQDAEQRDEERAEQEEEGGELGQVEDERAGGRDGRAPDDQEPLGDPGITFWSETAVE